MKYLFFDLEYATSRKNIHKICEFGYVVTNETFEVIQRGNFIINPNITRAEWDWRAVRTILTRQVSEYESGLTFDEYYNDIKKLITDADYIIGHSLNTDALALNQDSERYGFPSLDYDFYEVKTFYKQFSNTTKDTGVVNMLSELQISGETRVHDAETDAFNTMLELKQMLFVLNVSLSELIQLVPEAKDKTENYIVESIENNRIKKILKSMEGSNEMKRHGENKKKFLQFLDNVKSQKEAVGIFNGKKISFSINYEDHHFIQMLNLVQLISNEGGTVILKASDSDIFVKYDMAMEDNTIKEDSRLKHVLEANEDGSNIEVINFTEFLNRLLITEDELEKMPMPSFDCLFEDGTIIKDKNKLVHNKTKDLESTKQKDKRKNRGIYSSNFAPAPTLGDLYGRYFNELLKDENC